jgi:hypothetical protein
MTRALWRKPPPPLSFTLSSIYLVIPTT